MPRASTVHAVIAIGIDMGKSTLHMVGALPQVMVAGVRDGVRNSNANSLCWCILAEPTGIITISQIHRPRTDF